MHKWFDFLGRPSTTPVDRSPTMEWDEDFVSSDKPTTPDPAEQPNAVGENADLDKFFHRMPSNLRWPKPNAEAVAAAMDAIQRLSGGGDLDEVTAPLLEGLAATNNGCAACGQPLGEGMRFCGHCGAPIESNSDQSQAPVSGQHHVHHHYHHFVPAQGAGPLWPANEGAAASAMPAARVPGPVAKSATGSRAELAARQLVQDWAAACNTKNLDDLLELYVPDATLIRSNIPPVRSLAAIREFLFSLLEAGLGDVEMESLRSEIQGEIALEIGRCKMLVPVAMGKRREERGKYVLVLLRQPAGTWKILVDCWSSDLAVSAPSPADAVRRPADPASATRKPR